MSQDALADDGWRRPRAFAGQRIGIARFVRVRPERLARLQIVCDHAFILATLLLRNGLCSGDGESRPTRADRLSPKLCGRFCRPVGGELRSGQMAVAARTKELWEVRGALQRF